MTNVVALSSMKGGTGKTTIAYNLAERAHSSGLNCVLIDCDPQEGSLGLADLREEPGWEITNSRMGAAGAEKVIKLRDSGAYDLLICDLPGVESFSMGVLLAEADITLSPLNIGPGELQSAKNFRYVAENMGWSVVFVPNNLPASRRRRDELVEELLSWNARVCPVMLQRRVAHLDALRHGRGVCEALPKSAAALEVQSLWEWLLGALSIQEPSLPSGVPAGRRAGNGDNSHGSVK